MIAAKLTGPLYSEDKVFLLGSPGGAEDDGVAAAPHRRPNAEVCLHASGRFSETREGCDCSG